MEYEYVNKSEYRPMREELEQIINRVHKYMRKHHDTTFGSYLARLEALICVMSKNRTAISEVVTHLHHRFVWVARTVDRAYKVNLFVESPFGFLAVFDIVKLS